MAVTWVQPYPETPISGVWLQLQQENNGAVPKLPPQSPPLAVSSFAMQQQLGHVQAASVPTATPQPLPKALPSRSFPAMEAQPQPTWHEHQPVPAALSHQQRTHQPSTESVAPNCSHTHQFALLICSNGTNPLKDVKTPQALLLTGILDILPPYSSWENAYLQQREQSPSS